MELITDKDSGERLKSFGVDSPFLERKMPFNYSDQRSHIVDSIFFGDGYSTEKSRNIFSDLCRMQRWLDVEVALARAQAELGIIPREAPGELAMTANIDLLDIDGIRKEIKVTSHSLIPLLRAWQKIVSEETGQYIHYGATTQDIQDTAQVLEVRDILAIVESDLLDIIRDLTLKTEMYREFMVIGRTHGQQASPTTFGIKIASWLDECIRNYDRLLFCKKNVLVSQLFGSVGNMTALSEKGISLQALFSKELGLGTAFTCWHCARDRFVELLSLFALITGGLGKIANEIIQLNKNEMGELAEPFKEGQIGSSTMPHKRNPEICERVVALSKLVKGSASLSFDTLFSEHERDYRTIRLEWITITDASLYTCCALEQMKPVIRNLVVDRKRCKKNLKRALGFCTSESIMFLVGKKIGKQTAHELIYEAAVRAHDNETSLVDEVYTFPIIKEHFTYEELSSYAREKCCFKTATQLVDNIVKYSQNRFGCVSP